MVALEHRPVVHIGQRPFSGRPLSKPRLEPSQPDLEDIVIVPSVRIAGHDRLLRLCGSFGRLR